MITLISPAKNLDFQTPTPQTLDIPLSFEKETLQLAQKLQKLSAKKIADLMSLSDKLAQLNYERYQSFTHPFPEEEKRAAIFAFNGEVYNGLDAHTLSPSDLDYAERHLRILSGLYGVLTPQTSILPYRLEMGTKFQVTPKTKNLYAFWGKKIASLLQNELNQHKANTVINLASNEYFKAVDQTVLKGEVITPHFKDNKNGQYKVVMMYAKHARGAMARYIIQNRVENIEELKNYNGDNYIFNSDLSTKTDWVFTRG